MNLLIIKKICEQKGVSIRALADEIPMSEQNLYRCIRENKIQAGDLEKIAAILGVSVSIFYDENVEISVNGSNNQIQHGSGNRITLSGQQQEIEHLNRIIQEKDKIIEEKERLIQILMNK